MPLTQSQIIGKRLEPDFKFSINRKGSINKRADYLLQDNNLQEEYLGACLDYVRWGGQTTVLYEFGTSGLIDFIQHWMKLNKNNLIWTDKVPSEDFILPYVKHNQCPRDKKHNGFIKDLAGRVRCSHKSVKKLKPSFIRNYRTYDKLSGMNIIKYYDKEPESPSYDEEGNLLCDASELEKYEREMEKFNSEEPIVIEDRCYAILNDEQMVLPLKEVLDRLNLEPKTKTVFCPDFNRCQRLNELEDWQKDFAICPGHKEENNKTVHPFSGWTLAWYVQKWYEQVPDGQAPVFKK